MEQKLSIHRALAELKLLDSRIHKQTEGIVASGMKQPGGLVNQFSERGEFEKNAKAKYQSVIDLIERKTKIKAAIVQANATTTVTVGGKTMTIADAISQKAFINHKIDLINSLTRKHNAIKSAVEKNNKQVDDNALQIAQAALGDSNAKMSDKNVQPLIEPYLEKNRFELVDPLKVEELIDKLQEEVDAFQMEVDAVLSEVNALTFIEI